MKRKAWFENTDADDEGRNVVHINVTDDGNFMSPFSAAGHPVISGDTAEFLNNSIKHCFPERKINFIISSNEIDERERVLYEEAIKNYYRSEYAEIKRELRKNALQALIMTIIAAAVFTLAILLETLTDIKIVFLNMLDVCACLTSIG